MGTRVIHPVLGRGTLVPSEGEGEGITVQYDGGALVEYPGQNIGSEHRRLLDNLNFGAALESLKGGQRVGRTGWNGKGMWLVRVVPIKPSEDYPGGYSYRLGVVSESAVHFDMLGIRPLPWIGMKTADDAFVPWLASQTDLLAEDWEVVSDTVTTG